MAGTFLPTKQAEVENANRPIGDQMEAWRADIKCTDIVKSLPSSAAESFQSQFEAQKWI